MPSRPLAAVFLALTVAACAAGRTYDYRDARPDLNVDTERSIVMGVLDRRPYVVSGDKPPTFVGLQRAGFGNPFNVNTDSGMPLAADFRDALVAAMEARNLEIGTVDLPFSAAPDEAVRALRARGAGERLVLLTINEWKTDTYARVALYFDLSVEVYDREGEMLARHRTHGRDNLGTVAFPHEVGPLATAAARRTLSRLLEAPEITQALR